MLESDSATARIISYAVPSETMADDSRPYPDLHAHLDALKKQGLLLTVNEPIDKDSELHALVRWQFVGGIEEAQRKAFLFTNVVNAHGRKYPMPVVVGAMAANRAIYSVGMGVPVEKIQAKWDHALAHPVKPKLVANAACHEVVIQGDALKDAGH